MRASKVWIALAAVSCASTRAEMMPDARTLPAICPAGVAIYPDSTQIGKPFQEVATLISHGSLLLPDQNAILDSQRQEAAKLGANGVLLLIRTVNEPSGNSGTAIAILIPGDSDRVAAACNRR